MKTTEARDRKKKRLWCLLHVQNLHHIETGKPTIWSFQPYHVNASLSGEQELCDAFSVYVLRILKLSLQKKKKLRSLLQSTPTYDKLIMLGNFNARVGQESYLEGLLGNTVLETVTTTDDYCWSSAQSNNLPSSTPLSIIKTV